MRRRYMTASGPLFPGQSRTALGLCLILAGCAGNSQEGGLNLPRLFAPRSPLMAPESLVQRNLTGCGDTELRALTGHSFVTLAERNLPGDLRVLHPGQDVSTEIEPSRLNVQVDASGRMLNLFCG